MSPAQLTGWRQQMGWSRAEAARQLGISPRSLYNYEEGKRKIPEPVALACEALEKR